MSNTFMYIKDDGDILIGEEGLLHKVKTEADQVIQTIKSKLSHDKSQVGECYLDELLSNIVEVFKHGALQWKPEIEVNRHKEDLVTSHTYSSKTIPITDGGTVSETKCGSSAKWTDGADVKVSMGDSFIKGDLSAHLDAGVRFQCNSVQEASIKNHHSYKRNESQIQASAHCESGGRCGADTNSLGSNASMLADVGIKCDGHGALRFTHMQEKRSNRECQEFNGIYHRLKSEGKAEGKAKFKVSAKAEENVGYIEGHAYGKASGSSQVCLADAIYTKNKSGFVGKLNALVANAEGRVEANALIDINGKKLDFKVQAEGKVAAHGLAADVDFVPKSDESCVSIGGVHMNIGNFNAQGKSSLQENQNDPHQFQAQAQFQIASVHALQADIRREENCKDDDVSAKGGLVNANILNAKMVGEKTGKITTFSMDTTLAALNAGNVSVTGIDKRKSNPSKVHARVNTTASANIGNVDINGIGPTETRAEATYAPGLDAFNFKCGISRQMGANVSSNRKHAFNVDLSIGAPSLNLTSSRTVGNIAIPFFGGGYSGGGGLNKTGKNSNDGDADNVDGNSDEAGTPRSDTGGSRNTKGRVSSFGGMSNGRGETISSGDSSYLGCINESVGTNSSRGSYVGGGSSARGDSRCSMGGNYSGRISGSSFDNSSGRGGSHNSIDFGYREGINQSVGTNNGSGSSGGGDSITRDDTGCSMGSNYSGGVSGSSCASAFTDRGRAGSSDGNVFNGRGVNGSTSGGNSCGRKGTDHLHQQSNSGILFTDFSDGSGYIDRGNSSSRCGVSSGSNRSDNCNGNASLDSVQTTDSDTLNMNIQADRNIYMAALVEGAINPHQTGTISRTNMKIKKSNPVDWSDTHKVMERIKKKYIPNYTEESQAFTNACSKAATYSKPKHKKESPKPFGSKKNIHTIFTIDGNDGKLIKYIKPHIACFDDN